MMTKTLVPKMLLSFTHSPGNSVSCCEQLEKEKEEVRVSLEALFQKLQEQHQTELQQLEERLKDFYSAEWDKTHEAYQREADKCRALMQQQVRSYLGLYTRLGIQITQLQSHNITCMCALFLFACL